MRVVPAAAKQLFLVAPSSRIVLSAACFQLLVVEFSASGIQLQFRLVLLKQFVEQLFQRQFEFLFFGKQLFVRQQLFFGKLVQFRRLQQFLESVQDAFDGFQIEVDPASPECFAWRFRRYIGNPSVEHPVFETSALDMRQRNNAVENSFAV
jgi:hypothetical protein